MKLHSVLERAHTWTYYCLKGAKALTHDAHCTQAGRGHHLQVDVLVDGVQGQLELVGAQEALEQAVGVGAHGHGVAHPARGLRHPVALHVLRLGHRLQIVQLLHARLMLWLRDSKMFKIQNSNIALPV